MRRAQRRSRELGAPATRFVMLPAIVLIVIGGLIVSDEGGAGIAGEVLIGLGLVVFAVGAVFGSALRQVFAVVLYRFTTSGHAPEGFSEEDLRSAIRTRGSAATV